MNHHSNSDNIPALMAVELAEKLLCESLDETTWAESKQMKRLARLMTSPEAKQLSFAMTDQLGRSKDLRRVSELWQRMLADYGTDKGFSIMDEVLLDLGSLWSKVFPDVVMRAVRQRLVHESRQVILPAEEPSLSRYLENQADSGTRINLNQLGEAVLGEKEALRRLQSAIQLLQRSDVDYVSIKISAIYSQINLVAWEQSREIIKQRLRQLYQVAQIAGNKFVNLDMEAYHDLDLTIEAFQQVLDEPEFQSLSAGIALQAYLPDSISRQQQLTEWARKRKAKGGAPVKLRLVKGANLAMEKVEAELQGWHPVPHRSKADSDACFKQMLEYACRPENAAAVRIGVGSHNLFDVALALVLREKYRVSSQVEIEMIQGMAPGQARVVQKAANKLILYSPIVPREQYASALAYLIRRLDENTAPGNFLAALFSLKPGSEQWEIEKDRFLQAWRTRRDVPGESRRKFLPPRATDSFSNEPDTDWSQPRHRKALADAIAYTEKAPTADAEEIESALQSAVSAQKSWAAKSVDQRASLLRSCGYHLSQTRFSSIALLREEGKKAIKEADSEISEAIDFARYYAYTATLPTSLLKTTPLGTVVIAPPWNFPFAIPCGGILAALVAGNTVIFKPAPEVVQIGWWLVNQLWKAGIPKDVLQFVACADGEVGKQLIVDDRVSAVVLTGAYETARRFQSWRPELKLFAETSGKNAIVVSALADRELAAKDIVQSAFGHSGQKCSATSLAILEAEVYDDLNFLELIKDAASSLAVGPSTDAKSKVTPLVQPPGESLLRALTTLEPGETWLLKPERIEDSESQDLWSPGIKLGVRPGSWFHQTECFGPVLGLMRADDLSQAVEWQNAVKFGLTAGFHSLDEVEIAKWKQQVTAGNLYINRGTTGAIVQRQPFGGWKCSSIGPGSKAGGPNYVNLFRTVVDSPQTEPTNDSKKRFIDSWEDHFSKPQDPSGLKCELNQLRYVPVKGVLVRLPAGSRPELVEQLQQVADICGVPVFFSEIGDENQTYLIDCLNEGLAAKVDVFRTLSQGGESYHETRLLQRLYQAEINWIDAPFCSEPLVEMPKWLKEQSISETRHRYGNLVGRR